MQWFGVSPKEFRTLSHEGRWRQIQLTKYSHRIDQLSTAWNEESIQKMVDEAYRINKEVNRAYELELANMYPRTVIKEELNFIRRIGQFIIGLYGRIKSMD